MDYKEKYKEALSRAKEMCAMPTDKATMEYIFPELKESEDGQHRKWILEYLYDGLRKTDEQFKPQFESAIAWLEKQGQVKESHISQHESKTCEENNEFLTNEDERNLAWSEEDEQMVLIIEQVMNCASLLNIVPEKIDNIRSWLKSLRPQKQWKSNEKQGRKKDFALIESKFKKKVDADEVIDWIKTHGNFWPVVTIEISKVIAKFKKDFKL